MYPRVSPGQPLDLEQRIQRQVQDAERPHLDEVDSGGRPGILQGVEAAQEQQPQRVRGEADGEDLDQPADVGGVAGGHATPLYVDGHEGRGQDDVGDSGGDDQREGQRCSALQLVPVAGEVAG
jgi:hypothetical protein